MATGRSVLIVGEDASGNKVVTAVNPDTRGLGISQQSEILLESGRLFATPAVIKGLQNQTSSDLLMRTKSRGVHVSFRLESSGVVEMQAYEGPTVTDEGTQLATIARKRVPPLPTTEVEMYAGPTASALGTMILHEILPSGGERGPSQYLAEAILAPNTDYLLRLTNDSGGNIDVGVVVDWFEERTEVNP